MILAVSVQYAVGRLDLSVDTSLGAGLTALVGPSGAGKTTLLNIVAGVTPPSRGTIRWDDEVWLDTSRGIARPMHERGIGYVFQEPRLFPHLSVRHNLTYGRWFSTRRPARIGLDDIVALLGLDALLDRRPGKLSGGEAQRVALGRALLTQPRLLLLDEPLAAVDVRRRADVLPYLDRLRTELGIPMVYVTHAIGEVESRADRIVQLADGKIAADGQRAIAH